MIDVRHVSKHFMTSSGLKIKALENVSVTIQKGEIFGIIGSSGAGKSTLLRCLNMLERPDVGEIWVNGKNLTKLTEKQLQQERRHIGMIFQHFNLLSSRTIFGNVALPLELAGTAKSEIQTRVNELLALVGIADKANEYPSNLSGGQKQRVAIARALATNPSILLCDEATSALDPETTKSILKLLQKINQKFQITIALITHEIHVIKAICDRVAIVKDGQIVETGNKEEIFGAPKDPHTRQFVDSAVQAELPLEYQSILVADSSETHQDIILRVKTKNLDDYGFAQLQQKTGAHIQILEGHIETIGELQLGSFILRASNLQAEDLTLHKDLFITSEIIGYVPGSH